MSPIEEVKSMTSETIDAETAAKVLKCSPHSIRVTARARPEMLGFPTIVMGHRVRIPRIPFLRFLLGEEAEA